ncbi:MAG TPA: bifunctional DNA-binding transcriptional regulator/O6-methylguanine-DNA methyltransferase Ada [Blastocatellia bacterium]|nr:bifunctional DNA-binding transcriptional regulator/O6-methylguanine-DNA methyltransferase Ada [Blastocatellia bacterium]
MVRESLIEKDRWRQVVERDRSADGTFVYAVRSTGVYCRPSCSSRKPGLQQVEFYDRPEDAAGAGFRACKRCRPDDRTGSSRLEKVRLAVEFIERQFDEEIKLADIAAAAGLSPFYLQRVFKEEVGVTPKQYVAARRIERFKSRVKEGNSVTSAMYDAGFGSSSRLYERAATELGMSPASYKKGGQGTRIRFATADSSLGRILVASTERGVCKIAFGDRDADLERELRSEFQGAEISRDDKHLAGLVSAVRGYLEGQRTPQSISLDPKGTAFQRKVWEAISRIPMGETRSYGQIADEIGNPNAVRAVARACATNPVAVIIPCHRVISKDGATSGYRWGVQRKEALLKRERERASETGSRM